MPATDKAHFVGLDIGKDKLDYSVSATDEGIVANTEKGRRDLCEKLKLLENPRVVCEASGGYEKAILAELLNAGIEVCVAHPSRVRAYAYAEGLLAKTDKIDARLLRRFGEKVNPRLATPTEESVTTLRQLVEHRRQLTTQLTEVTGRLDLAGKTLAKLLSKQEAFLKKQIRAVEKMIEDHIDNDPNLREKSDRLQQVKGIGPILSATTLAYVPELGKMSGAQISALIGVAPHPKDSSRSSAPRHIRGGRSQVREVLYMAAVAAAHSNPILRAFFERLSANGKPFKVCMVAVMRKIVCLMNRIVGDPDFTLAN